MNNTTRLKKLLYEYALLSQNRTVLNLEKADYKLLINHFIKEEQFERALQINELAQQTFPYDLDFLVIKIEVLIELNQPTLALDLLDSLNNLSKLSIKTQFLRAEALSLAGRKQDAIGILKQLEKNKHANPDVYRLHTSILEGLQQFDSLYHIIKDQIRVSPEYTLAKLINKFLFYTEITESQKDAVPFYKEILNKYPFSSETWLNLGLTYKELNMCEEAMDAFEFCIALDPYNQIAYTECASCFERDKKYTSAIQYYYEFLANTKQEKPDILTRIGNCMILSDNQDMAQITLERAIELNPQLDEAYYLLAQAVFDTDIDKAIASLEKASELQDCNEQYLLALATANYTAGNLQEAFDNYSLARDCAPDNIEIWIPLISFLLKVEWYRELMDALDEVSAYFNSNEVIYFKIAALFSAKKRDDAIFWLTEALETNIEGSETLFSLLPSLEKDDEIVSMIFSAKGHQ